MYDPGQYFHSKDPIYNVNAEWTTKDADIIVIHCRWSQQEIILFWYINTRLSTFDMKHHLSKEIVFYFMNQVGTEMRIE